MTLILKIKIKYLFLLGSLIFMPGFLHAQEDSLSLSVSPTLYEMTANPGQVWDSTIRVVNANPYEITVYADAVNFLPQGETGQPRFLPITANETVGQTLAEWINIAGNEFKIPAEETKEISFRIQVPDNAPPGGHYAALLIGTKPDLEDEKRKQLETSQVVTSLVFLSVSGDVVEEGQIRSFRTDKYITERPEINFELRFENKGNVHILPQGEIKITNMWGEERGVIPINRHTLFGNVLPQQVRKYSFSWSGDWSWSDIGRYKATASLAYGTNGRSFAKSEVSFWVLPWKIAGTILLIVGGFLYLLVWGIKLYIRKMLALAGLPQNISETTVKGKRISMVAPISEGILDLRQSLDDSSDWSEKLKGLYEVAKKYKTFMVVVATSILFIIGLTFFVKDASTPERSYEVTIQGSGEDVKLSSEQIEYEELVESAGVSAIEEKDFPPIKLINRSDINGLAAKMRIELEESGYKISSLSTDFTDKSKNTVIVYHPDFQSEAIELSGVINNSILSSYAEADISEPIKVYIGYDYENDI